MIVICEPQCREFSHEKVNSGFIYGLRLAYPQEKLIIYADRSHIHAIKNILTHDHVVIDNIEYVPIHFNSSLPILGMCTHFFLFRKMFSRVLKAGTNKIFFLSFSPAILYVIKTLKRSRYFSDMKFAFVLHGNFENIADERDRPVVPALPYKPILGRLRRTRLIDFPRKIAGRIIGSYWRPAITNLFPIKKMLLWKNSTDYKYIALSPHILANAEEYIDTKALNIHAVVLPTVFAKPTPPPGNAHIKFASFGMGDSFRLRQVAVQLSQRQITKPYEIRIIGRDDRGTEGFPNITRPSAGEPLTRSDMEKYAQDIDVFLILYDKNRYRLSCSNAILEALSNMKPVLHFHGDCMDFFNRPDRPIGIGCDTMEEFVNTMADMIDNYQTYIPKFQVFRNNLAVLRKEFAIENQIAKIRDAFTWQPEAAK